MSSVFRRSGAMTLLFIVMSLLASVAAAQSSNAPTFKKEQLDQMLAPVALYPDALLSQVLMACTYPSDVADAAAWSKANPKSQGDAAVKAVANQSWDPSVQSLVAFPQVLAQMAQQPDWVQNVGDAFLAQPQDVMDSVQRLRTEAQKAGNLKSNDQQKVVVQQSAPDTTVIQIEPANPQVVYVPAYNPTVVYGSWAYPAYPPPVWPPPPGYSYPVLSGLAAGLAFGTGIAIADSLWGGFDWHHGDVNINVNRYNNLNVNNRISGNGNVAWNHNPANRRGTPYRDPASRARYSPGVAGADQRQAFRGHDQAREAQRQNALQSFNHSTNNGAASNLRQHEGGAGAGQNLQARDNAGSRLGSQGAGTQRDIGAQRANQVNRGGELGNRAQPSSRPNAFNGVQQPSAARQQMQRGQSSQQSFRSERPAAQGHQISRPSPARSGGGGRMRR